MNLGNLFINKCTFNLQVINTKKPYQQKLFKYLFIN